MIYFSNNESQNHSNSVINDLSLSLTLIILLNIFPVKIIEKIKLQKRANRYKNKDDIGGISFINSSIKKGQTVLDIGAHKAGYLYWIQKRVSNSGKIIAFEPQSFLFDFLLMIKSIYKWHNVDVECLALSNFVGKANLYIPNNKIKKQSSPEASLLNTQSHKKIEKTEIVKIETLDNYCHLNNIKPDFLKIDVEGNELNVLRGGEKIINECKPKILIEIEFRHAGGENVFETFRFFQSLGYIGHFIHNSQRIALAEFSLNKFQNKNDMKNYCNNFTFETT